MLTCIACSNQLVEEESGGEGARGTPSTKEAAKSLTSQIKDLALKFSGACKSGSSSSSSYSKKGQRGYPEFDTASEGGPSYPYGRGGGSSSSTPAWDFSRTHRDHHGVSDSRFRGIPSVSTRSCDVVLEDEDEPKEWMAQVEPGVQITFVSLPQGGNDLKRIRFSREMFNKWQAQRWWGENYDRIVELYNVQRFSRQALHTPPRGDDEVRIALSVRESPGTPSMHKDWTPRNYYNRPPPGSSKGYYPGDAFDHGGGHHHHFGAGPSSHGGGIGGFKMEASTMEPSRTTTSSRGDEASVSISNASDIESEWVEQDEPGVYITIRQLPDGTRELRRVRFSREKFGEVHAKLWWEANRERIQAQYL
ncbi:hypothetical protein Sjap_004059 [Stephania japonica]|uniref:BRX domain-containing protein n=1 Tax=Stephania japonica TaxID=461633 RepID=A0AAP0K1R8_9MAGN